MPHAYDVSREANILAALALAVSDRIALAIEHASGLEGSAPAALLTLDSPGWLPTVQGLAEAVDLTHSGTVRLVDRLEQAGFVERRPGADRRSLELGLTPAGRRTAARIRSARADTAQDLLGSLTRDQRQLLTTVQTTILGGVEEHSADVPWVCRLCNRYACRHGRGGCPVEDATRRRPAASAGRSGGALQPSGGEPARTAGEFGD